MVMFMLWLIGVYLVYKMYLKKYKKDARGDVLSCTITEAGPNRPVLQVVRFVLDDFGNTSRLNFFIKNIGDTPSGFGQFHGKAKMKDGTVSTATFGPLTPLEPGEMGKISSNPIYWNTEHTQHSFHMDQFDNVSSVIPANLTATLVRGKWQIKGY